MTDDNSVGIEARWSADQALIWIVGRDLDACARASRKHKGDRLQWLIYTFEDVNPEKVQWAEQELLAALADGRVSAWDGDDEIPVEWLEDAEWQQTPFADDAASMQLVRSSERRPIAEFSDGSRMLGSHPAQYHAPRVRSADIMAAFPAQRGASLTLVASRPSEDEGAEDEKELSPTFTAIRSAIAALWPDGIPPLPSKVRNDEIRKHTALNAQRSPEDRTIYRYFAAEKASAAEQE